MKNTIISVLCLIIVSLSAGLVVTLSGHNTNDTCLYTDQVKFDLIRYEALKTKSHEALELAFIKYPNLQEDEFSLSFIPSNN